MPDEPVQISDEQRSDVVERWKVDQNGQGLQLAGRQRERLGQGVQLRDEGLAGIKFDRKVDDPCDLLVAKRGDGFQV